MDGPTISKESKVEMITKRSIIESLTFAVALLALLSFIRPPWLHRWGSP